MCEHLNFRAQVNVHRMSDTEGGPITGYMSEVRVNCAECDLPFQFHGLEMGIDTHGARVSVDGLEARIAISPEGAKPSPIRRMAFDIHKFDG